MKHDVLWAPWRMAYVGGEVRPPQQERELLPGGEAECFMCQAAVTEDFQGALLLERGQHVMTLLNRFPYNNGHLLIAPHRHIPALADFTEAEMKECWQRLAVWPAVLERAFKAQGFNMGLNLGTLAGAGMPGHLHWHIVPRWSGDVNFMGTLAGAKVIPQALEAAWEILSQAWQAPCEG